MKIIVWPLMFIVDIIILLTAHIVSLLMWDRFYANHYWSDGDLFIDLYFRAKERNSRKRK